MGLPPRQKRGFMIVRKTEGLLSEYFLDSVIQKNRAYLDDFKKKLIGLNAEVYRGISRYPLSPVDEDKDGAEIIASVRFAELINEDRSDWYLDEAGYSYNVDLIPSFEQAIETFRWLQRPEFHEIIEVTRDEFETDFEKIGFDIGYWGGDHFSIICDSVVMPRWHPPDPEDWDEVVAHASHLNTHLLFDRSVDAQTFREYYLSKDWAEEEGYPGEFCIIQIALPE
jgi:hypothetical protein